MNAARGDLVALIERRPDFSNVISRGVTEHARRAAVLILFGELDATPDADAEPALRNLDLLLLRRAATLRTHAGQVAFPGGGLDPGETPVEAALREAVEETGLDPSGVEVLGTLSEVPAPVSDHWVTPVLGWWSRTSEVVAVDHAETVEVFRVPVADLIDPANRVIAEALRGATSTHSEGFLVAGTLVWGFTGKVLNRLLDELGWSEPWDRTRVVPVPAEMLGLRP